MGRILPCAITLPMMVAYDNDNHKAGHHASRQPDRHGPKRKQILHPATSGKATRAAKTMGCLWPWVRSSDCASDVACVAASYGGLPAFCASGRRRGSACAPRTRPCPSGNLSGVASLAVLHKGVSSAPQGHLASWPTVLHCDFGCTTVPISIRAKQTDEC